MWWWCGGVEVWWWWCGFSSDNNTTLGLCWVALGCGNSIFKKSKSSFYVPINSHYGKITVVHLVQLLYAILVTVHLTFPDQLMTVNELAEQWGISNFLSQDE